MPDQQTKWGVPVVFKNERSNTFQICRYGDLQKPLASGFQDINQVGAYVRARGGAMGAIKEQLCLGRYREIFLPGFRAP